jgi:hypothetical protein
MPKRYRQHDTFGGLGLHEDVVQYRLKAEYCFSLACAVDDAVVRQQSLDAALYWFRLAEQTENRRRRVNVYSSRARP